jgi:hypothetical protein
MTYLVGADDLVVVGDEDVVGRVNADVVLTSSALPTASAVSAGSIWKTPKPSCGMDWPSLSLTDGTTVVP